MVAPRRRSPLLAGVCLSAALTSLACGFDGSEAGSGGAPSATGGVPATGGAASGSGGSSAGGAISTGGVTSTGGSSSGTGGSSSGVDWDEVRCWQHQETATRTCYARFGNLWTPVAPVCTVVGEPHHPMDQNATACASQDSSSPWEETWCDDLDCYGRLGDWLTVLRAPCETPEATLSSGTPSSSFCTGVVEAPVGWHDVHCLAVIAPVTEPYCYGFIGLYFPDSGLYPTCYIEAEMAGDPDLTEVPPDSAHCP